jgi:hypothetical protein
MAELVKKHDDRQYEQKGHYIADEAATERA